MTLPPMARPAHPPVRGAAAERDGRGRGHRQRHRGRQQEDRPAEGEKKGAKFAQKLGQLQPFIAVLPVGCMDQVADLQLLGRPDALLAAGADRRHEGHAGAVQGDARALGSAPHRRGVRCTGLRHAKVNRWGSRRHQAATRNYFSLGPGGWRCASCKH